MSDVLLGLSHLIKHSNFQLPSSRGSGGSGPLITGKPFELYCKDWLSLLPPGNINNRFSYYNQEFSYQGSANNPPDVMFKGGDMGDSFEFKKTESKASAKEGKGTLKLNSSYPKDMLRVGSSGLLKACIQCETWQIRTFYYVLGNIQKGSDRLTTLWVVDGRFMSANPQVYANIFSGLQAGVKNLVNAFKLVAKINSKEGGRLRNIDALDSTVLRVRSMWELESPKKAFANLPGVKEDKTKSVLHAMILNSRWEEYPQSSRDSILNLKGTPGFTISDIQSIDPNDKNKTLKGKLIRYEV